MTETLRKMYMVGVGIADSVIEKVKTEIDQYAEAGEKAHNGRFSAAKNIYDTMEKGFDQVKETINPFSKKFDEQNKRLDNLSKKIEDLTLQVSKKKGKEGD